MPRSSSSRCYQDSRILSRYPPLQPFLALQPCFPSRVSLVVHAPNLLFSLSLGFFPGFLFSFRHCNVTLSRIAYARIPHGESARVRNASRFETRIEVGILLYRRLRDPARRRVHRTLCTRKGHRFSFVILPRKTRSVARTKVTRSGPPALNRFPLSSFFF